jgi:hypothetical protein
VALNFGIEGDLIELELSSGSIVNTSFSSMVLGGYGYTIPHFVNTHAVYRKLLLRAAAGGFWICIADSNASITAWNNAVLVALATVQPNGECHRYSASGGAFTLTIAAGASHGQEIEFKEVGNVTTVVTLASGGGGTTFEPLVGGALVATVPLNIARLCVRYRFDGPANVWRLVHRVF